MKRTVPGLMVFCALLLSACATNPFPKVQRVDISGRDPQTVVERFGDEITQDFEALQSVTINFFGKEMTGLGYLSVDQKTRSFNLTCMTPMGVRLLTIQKDPNGLNAEFSFSDEVDQRKILSEMARDIGRLYFDWTPTPTAVLKRSRYALIFTEKRSEGGKTRFVFGGPEARLIEKQIMGKGGRVTIQYHDYQKSSQGLYPQGVFLKNKKYHYTLIIRTKEFHVD
ncbi:MAG: DUF3261 domain-containing protein [candidate division Zixibacteria bacterium]